MSSPDVIEILAIILAAGLVSELVAGILRLPRMIVLLVAGILLGPELLDALDVPLDSIGVQLLFSLGVSFILFYGVSGFRSPSSRAWASDSRCSQSLGSSCRLSSSGWRQCGPSASRSRSHF
ncbi:MAG: hypothetical protein H0U90_06195 [Actinobacteria bacterium]|nr:hypothetical protein [Actinomycetota bacterium]